ncbi:hypothetical protein BSL78_07243 [Apostichopus japonicus]|uniref:Uncharacterized protein n=1 Tax=Stichopus japonicus TaxID=307972 RepID=A0A2G8L6G6_STIJA|nr:hypothetical protein BSL78_07243 [Apostichopus japonicus]
MISIRLDGQPVKTTIIQVYAPTSAASDEDTQNFYGRLQDLVDSVPRGDALLLWETGMQRLEKNQLLASVGDMAWVRGTRQVKKQDRVNKYSLNEIPERYSIEVKNSFAALDLTERKPDELWQEVEDIIKKAADRNIPRAKKQKKSKWLSKKAIEIADKRREAKKQGIHNREFRQLNADFQYQARKDKENHLNRVCAEIEADNQRGRTRDVFKKIRDITGEFKPRVGSVKSNAGGDLCEESL